MSKQTVALLSMLAAVRAQQAGTLEPETHPSITYSECTGSGSCTAIDGEIVIDANWRWLHNGDGTNCYDGNAWTDACSDQADCTASCAVEGATYDTTYGITTSGDELRLNFATEHAYGTNVGSRTYLMESPDTYKTFELMNNEFAFDVDLSTIGCGLNSALYFVAMEADGGLASQPNNEAGAEYGTGYCDAQCARDLKFVGGEANYDWTPSDSDDQAGVGSLGSCCAEIDVWESNSHSYAFTPHGCSVNEYHVCESDECGGTYSEDRFAGNCDANGCDFNPYRLGNTDFYGEGLTVDTSAPFTVVTQFTPDAYTQFFVQDGVRIDPPAPTYEGISTENTVNDEFCTNNFVVFDERDRYAEVGGWAAMTDALNRPLVLVMSIWADHYANMLWLDSIYPPEQEGEPGAARGDCPQDSGVPAEVIAEQGDSYVVWSNIRYGPIGSTTGL